MLHALRIHAGAGRAAHAPATVLDFLSRNFGGATLLVGSGAWNDGEQTITEPIHELIVAVSPDRRNEVLSVVERLYPNEKAFGVEWRGDYFILDRGDRIV